MTELFRDLAEGDPPRALNRGLWARRAAMTVLAVVVVVALLDVLGQRASRSSAAGPAAALSLRAPKVVRGGLLFESRVEITARRAIDHPRLVLADGWVEGMQVNSVSPDAEGTTSRGGDVVLSFPALRAGERRTIRMQFQVDPTNVGHRSYDLELDDAETALARIDRTLTILP
ncbi:MAG: hypothetical protein JWQ18_3835 [Conexibacter sp.]|nr:hypothetical protein [Conexibacter sp.]